MFFGPYANFAKMSEYAIVHSSGVLLKGVLGFPILCGIWYGLRHHQWQYYALFVYLFMSSIMLVVAGVVLDMRYQITMFPFMLPFAAKFMQEHKLKVTFFLYILLLFILIWFYNKR